MEPWVSWSEKKQLIEGTEKGITYKLKDKPYIPHKPGVYIFARMHGEQMIPIYIGKAVNLHQRIKHHLRNRSKGDGDFMKAIKNDFPGVSRYLVIGTLEQKQGVDAEKAIHIIEQGLIEHSLAEGHDLLNKSGTKRPCHNIHFKGNLFARSFTGTLMKVKKQG